MAALVDKLHLIFPVGHSADAHAVAAVTGAFVNPDPTYLQSTGFSSTRADRCSSACTRAVR